VRVCFVSNEFPPHPGGIARSACRITDGLAASGVDIHVFVPVIRKPVRTFDCRTERRSSGVHIHWVSTDDDAFLHLSQVLSSYDRQLSFDVFHGFTIHLAYPCLSVAGTRPVIASFRGIDAIQILVRPYAFFAAEILRRARWVTAVSNSALSGAQRLTDITGRCSFIPNAIDCSEFRDWAVNSTNRGVVGTVCMFRRKKDIPTLIRAYGFLPQSSAKATPGW
jgi:L-malate glycosyltransferase